MIATPLASYTPKHATASPAAQQLRSKALKLTHFLHLPLSFEPNRGQVVLPTSFLSHGSGETVFLRSSGAELQVASANQKAHAVSIALDFLGSNRHPRVFGRRRLAGKVNYFIGNNPRKWITSVPTYAMVEYADVYRGINLVYHGSRGRLEYDWLLKPGANPHVIKLGIRGLGSPRVDTSGGLLLQSRGRRLVQEKPLVYQWLDGRKRSVTARYTVAASGIVGFQLGRYNRREPLVIDPVLVYSTFLGGTDTDVAFNIAVDAQGNAYVAGDTLSLNFPTVHPIKPQPSNPRRTTDAFVFKLNRSGSALVYSTYLSGSDVDEAHAIAIDSKRNAYVTGSTLSRDFPTFRANQARFAGGSTLGDAFVTKLSPFGSALVYSTYLGGRGDDDGNAIAVSGGSAFVTGRTNSPDFPRRNALPGTISGGSCSYQFHVVNPVPCYDAFVAKLGPKGMRLMYSTHLGGQRTDSGWGIAVRNGRAYIAGETSSKDFPLVHSLQRFPGGNCSSESCSHVFISQLNSRGNKLLFSTYLGGSHEDVANALALDSHGNTYITGQTTSSDFPMVHAFQRRFGGDPETGFVTKVNADLRLQYSTYLGGSGSDEGYGIAVDQNGNAYVTGRTSSTNFPILKPIQPHLASGEAPQNAFLTKLNSTGNGLVYSTYLGGNNHDSGNGIAVGLGDNVYVTGATDSSNFPTARAWERRPAGGVDVFIAEISGPPVKVPRRRRVAHRLNKCKKALVPGSPKCDRVKAKA